jgi:hypothetical protein
MEEQHVSFETAKLAKKKRFDIIQRYGMEASLYNKDGNHTYYANYGFMYSGLSDGYISAPTQSLLARWIREIHNIHIEIYCNASGWGYILTKLNGTTIKEIMDDVFFDSNESAFEVGLNEALKLIK